MKRNLYILSGVTLIFTLIVSACSSGSATTPQQIQAVEQPTAAPDEPQPTAGEGSPAATGAGAARNDIPIMEGARELQIMRDGSSIVYTVDAELESVVDFYKEELPKNGWELAGPPDSAVASIATMLRENDSGDRMTINMQKNELGGFVKVNISVVRAN